MTLLEEFKGRVALAEKYYAQQNGGAKLSNDKKIITAQCLKNVSQFMNESFNMSVGTQRSDVAGLKMFCNDVTTLTVPNLIVHDLFLVQPMATDTGKLIYMKYGFGETKSGVTAGTIFQNNNGYGTFAKMTKERMQYTSRDIVETNNSAVDFTPGWTSVIKGKGTFVNNDVEYDARIVRIDTYEEDSKTKYGDTNGTVSYANFNSNDKIAASNFPAAPTAGQGDPQHTYSYKVAYAYDNESIPQEKLPTITAEMGEIPLNAKARRIALFYSQLAAYTAKQNYGIDFESTVVKQAQAELEYQTDSEAVFLIQEAADAAATKGDIGTYKWTDEELDTISYSMKAEGFVRKIEQAKQDIYLRTQRVNATWMLVSPELLPILTFVPTWKGSVVSSVTGPYVAGEVCGLKVIVSPILSMGNKVAENDVKAVAYLGVLGNDGKTATGVRFTRPSTVMC